MNYDGKMMKKDSSISGVGVSEKVSAVTSEEIDILRGFAAIGVIVSHSFAQKYIVWGGGWWVWAFFIVSGFLQGCSFLSGRYQFDLWGIYNYYHNRFLRIIPLFWFAIIIAWVIQYFSGHLFCFAMMIEQLTCFVTDYTPIDPLWSIACELQFYLFVPFIVWIIKERRGLLYLLIPFLIWDVYWYHHIKQFEHGLHPRWLLGVIHLFIIGILCSFMYRFRFTVKPFIKGILLVLLLAFAAFTQKYFPSQKWEWEMGGWDTVSVVAICMLILLIKSERTKLYDLFIPIRFIGIYCYGVYVYAALIRTLCMSLFGLNMGNMMFILQLCAIPLAYVSYHLIEKHFLKLKK